jgi:hypothetical protein
VAPELTYGPRTFLRFSNLFFLRNQSRIRIQGRNEREPFCKERKENISNGQMKGIRKAEKRQEKKKKKVKGKKLHGIGTKKEQNRVKRYKAR